MALPAVLPQILAGTASALFVIAYLPYFRRLVRREIRPSVLYWGLWTTVSSVGAATYWEVTGRDLTKSVIALGSLGFAFAVTAIRLGQVLADRRAAKSSAPNESPWKVDRLDVAVTLGALAALVVWQAWSAVAGNLVQLTAAVIAHVPLLRQLARDPRAEHPLPWVGWAMADSLMLAVLASKGSALAEFVAPATYLSLTLCVIVLCTRRGAAAPQGETT